MADTEPRQPESSQTDDVAKRRSHLPLIGLMLAYAVLAAAVVVLAKDKLNVDGVAYIRIAKYYAEGNFDLAVTGYWAPLLSWLLIPFRWVGCDAVLAGHLISAIAGAFFVLVVYNWLRALRCSGSLLWSVTAAAALLSLNQQGWGIIADPLFTALLTTYFMLSHRTLRSGSAALAAHSGAMAALAYYAKYYALPFFLLHHLLVCLLILGPQNGRRHWGKALACWSAGTFVFAACAAPWIYVLSDHYGRPTFATTGKIVHSLAGPEVPQGDFWPNYLLEKPRDGRVTSWEDPDEIMHVWPAWSLLQWPEGPIHQLRLLYRNTREITHQLMTADGLGLGYAVLLAGLVLACFPRKNNVGVDVQWFRWFVITILAYLSGLLVVFAGTRRYYWPLQGLQLVQFAAVAQLVVCTITKWRCAAGREGTIRLAPCAFSLLVLVAAVLPIAESARYLLSRPGADLRALAEKLSDRRIQGPIAGNHWHNLVITAYFLDVPSLGVPMPQHAAPVIEQLEEVGASHVLLFAGESQPIGAAPLESVLMNERLETISETSGTVSVEVIPISSSQ